MSGTAVRGRDTASGDRVRVRASGKLNLALGVGRRQGDGYHPLATIFQAVSAYEDVTATRTEGVSVTVSGLHAELVPLGEENLAVRAARLLAEATGVEPAVHLHLHKGIPVGGGMAGGSADAAAALVACDALWGTGLRRDQIGELAALLGSDVPFALHGHTAVGRGRGHLITPAMTRGEYHWALGLRTAGLSTPAVYAAFDDLIGDAAPVEPRLDAELMRALRSGNAVALGAALSNDLQPAALELAPDIAETLAVAEDAGALGVLVSGSGPTVAALAADDGQAVAIGSAMLAAGVADDVLYVTGPVAGARLVHGVDQAPQADDGW